MRVSAPILLVSAAALFAFSSAQDCPSNGSKYDAWSSCIHPLTNPPVNTRCSDSPCSCTYYVSLSSCWNDYCPKSASAYNPSIQQHCKGNIPSLGPAQTSATATADSRASTNTATPAGSGSGARASQTGGAFLKVLPTAGVMGAAIGVAALMV